MREVDFYLPETRSDGSPINPAHIGSIKEELGRIFGGYTQITHRSEGLWKVGGVTFRDQITMVRVLDDGSEHEQLSAMKQRFAKVLDQEQLLVVAREITLI